MKYQAVKGMKDILPGEIEAWQIFEKKSRQFLEGYGFREIKTPVLESTELFARSIGEASDIVHKEMYTFQDRGGRSLTMRPEMTASVVRAVLEHSLMKQNEPLFLYYFGSMYRAERPQAGRKREFYQLGVETLNTHSAENDAELLVMVRSYLEWLGLKEFTIKLNNLGSADDRKQYIEKLRSYFSKHENKLCEDCKYRLSKNVLRVFDCKVSECKPVIEEAPSIELGEKSKQEFETIQNILTKAKVPFHQEPKLVRGLDYYTGCVFEVTAKGLGAQDALLAGGRYDGLIQSLGGPSVGASGFALGVERLLMALEANQIHLQNELVRETVYVAAIADHKKNCEFYRQIAEELAKAGKRSHFSFSSKSVGNHLKAANQVKAGFAVIIGEDEFLKEEVTLKNMDSGEQKRLKPAELKKAF